MGVKGTQYRNQSQLHEWLTKKTYDFLAYRVTQRGIIWRQEHTIHNGMRPDAVAFCSLQNKYYEEITGKEYPRDYMVREIMAELGFDFSKRHIDCKEWVKYQGMAVNKYFGIENEFMIVFETKVSYSDYRNSFNGSGEYKEKPYANLHFLVFPEGFTKAYTLLKDSCKIKPPDHWGILEPSPRALKIIKLPKYVGIERNFFLEAAYTILFKWGKAIREIEKIECRNEINQ